MIARVTKDGREQSLIQHTHAVADWAELFGAKVGFGRFMRLAGLLHDAGKASAAFQNYMRQVSLAFAGLGPMPERGSVTHSTQAAKVIFEKHRANTITLERMSAEILAMLLASHHGHLPDSVSPDGATPLRDRLIRDIPALSDQRVITYLNNELLTESEYGLLFADACQEALAFITKVKPQKDLDLYFSLHLLVKHLFSCLIDADRFDAYCFEAKLDPQPRDVISPDWGAFARKLENRLAEFTNDSVVNKLRAHVSNICLSAAQNPPGVYRLNVPTGGGKTLASLRFALNHARANQMSRVIYIIPYLSILEQTVQTVREILGDEGLLEHHSNLLPEEKGEDYSLLAERWDSGLIFTTMTRFLESVFSGGTRGLRKMHHLAGAVLIFDEIQSLPLNCVHLFNGTINYLSRICGATVLLCTATQPLLDHAQRPLLLSENADIAPDLTGLFRGFRRVRLLDARIPGGYTPSALAAFTLEKLAGLSNGLVVLNTRKDVRRLFHALKKMNATLPRENRFRLYHLSTSMCPAHRLAILNEVKRLLGKERLICVSTQLIEAGVDISFECVIRALTGLDSVIQAFGRCNRNGEYSQRDCYVVNVADENLAMLPDIQRGAEQSRQILDEIKREPSAYDGNALSLAAIRRYYEMYFYKSGDKMDFGIKMLKTTLYDLLSVNRLGIAARGSADHVPPVLSHSFATAGENFYVIAKNIAVLAPYDKGKEIITELSGDDIDIKRKRELLKTAGRYSVNLFDYQIRKLEKEGGLIPLADGIRALSDGYYDSEFGFHTDKCGDPEK
ncbi:MAG: CRISPR-associated helicase Cas3' [Peptococcaceae bacterium]|nr:CRISPR-associated helicase Cas3' [Peptococcaceae bacterium]